MSRPDRLNIAGWLLIAALAGAVAVLGLATLAAWATKEEHRD